jgi:hypothetical protein
MLDEELITLEEVLKAELILVDRELIAFDDELITAEEELMTLRLDDDTRVENV